MSYLPRMSKTYKEPKLPLKESLEENTTPCNLLQPASCLLNEKTCNPQMLLKHYRYFPHPLPVLPGPSVAEEVMENEIYREAVKQRRSSMGLDSLRGTSQSLLNLPSTPDESEEIVVEDKPTSEFSQPVKRSISRKTIKGSKGSAGRKKSSKILVERKKENISKSDDVTINSCFLGSSLLESFAAAQTEKKDRENNDEVLNRVEFNSLKSEKSDIPINDNSHKSELSSLKLLDGGIPEKNLKEFTNRSIQCTIFGSAEKIFVIPLVIHSLLRALAFLLYELNREEIITCSTNDIKRLMTQIQLSLGDLCNQKIEQNFSFGTTYLDSKRIEKIMENLKKYVTDLYGVKNENFDKSENIKKVFIEMKKKEMEFTHLNDKLEEALLKKDEFLFNENDFKHPEVTVQNKRLESEQLLAEIEFSRRELKKYQNSIAEIEWDIKNNNEEVTKLKKSLACKSEILGKKVSSNKFSKEIRGRGKKRKENENCDNNRKK